MKTDFEEWAKTQDPAFIRDVFSAAAAFQAAQQSERERITRIVDEVGVQGNHDEWFDCCDTIRERLKNEN